MRAFFLLALTCTVLQANAVTLTVESLYDAKSRIPTALIPLRVSGDAINAGGTIFDVSVLANGGADCRAMKDPFTPTIYLLKCDRPSQVTVVFKVSAGGQLHQIQFGPLEIQIPAGTVIVPPTSPETETLAGRQLFNTYCIECHSDARAKRGKSAARIRDAVFNQISGLDLRIMQPPPVGQASANMKAILTPSDYTRLELYLRNP